MKFYVICTDVEVQQLFGVKNGEYIDLTFQALEDIYRKGYSLHLVHFDDTEDDKEHGYAMFIKLSVDKKSILPS